jgi:hypothetical protein
LKIELQAQLFSINAADPDGTPRRVVEGVAIPWNVEAVVSGGQRVKFLPGSLPTDGANPKFILGHDMTKPLGMVSERVSTPDAMLFSASLYDTNLANETLLQAGPGQFYDSVSVGVEPTDYSFEGSTMVVKAGNWTELSLLPFGAFEGAKVAVAAEAPETQDPTPTDSEEEPEVATQETPDTVEAAVPTQVIYAGPKREFKLPSASEYIASFVRGGHDFAQLNDNIRAAAPDVTTPEIPGVIPTPIVQPIFNSFVGSRPLVDATTLRQMPQGGAVFIRPVVSVHSSIGTAVQNTTITASAFEIDDVQITKTIQGGYVEISEASLDWSQPEVLGALLDDMARVYADRTDLLACSELQTGTTNSNNFANASIADPAYWVEWMYTAAADILSGSNGNLPSILAVSPNVWKLMGSLSDTADRPLFPQVGPMNAFGSLNAASTMGAFAFGLRVVVDRNLTSAGMTILDPRALESYENARGAISVEMPSQLSRQIAFRGYWASKLIDPTLSIKAAFV